MPQIKPGMAGSVSIKLRLRALAVVSCPRLARPGALGGCCLRPARPALEFQPADRDLADLAVAVAAALNVAGDAQDAAHEACLWLLWKHVGKATASLVIPGHPKLHVPAEGEFDGEK